MTEMEFLPRWYVLLRRHRRVIAAQAVIAGTMAAFLGVWLVVLARHVSARQSDYHAIQSSIAMTRDQVRRLHDLREIRLKMTQQTQVVRRLGTYVPTSRLVDELDALMPDDMALLDLTMDTQTQARAEPVPVAKDVSQIDRRLRVSLHGIAPGDDDIGQFLTRLSTVSYFKEIAMNYSRDLTDHGHAMREFEITFTINLSEGDR